MKNVAVVGQGYVGLPLAIEAAKAGYRVIGIDNNLEKVNELNSGRTNIEGINTQELSDLLASGDYLATTDFTKLREVEIVLICVPTPLNHQGHPDLTILSNATSNVARNISRRVLVILESSVAPGTTRKLIYKIVIEESGFDQEDVDIAYSPERIDPMNTKWNLHNTPKIIGGINKKSSENAKSFYSKFVETLIDCESLEVAETAKLLENSFRLVNISLVNELAIFCDIIGINVEEVIQAASSKPYGYMPFFPSLGAGGHCIPVDPVYLADTAHQIGAPSQLIDLAVKINSEMPGYFVTKAEEYLGTLIGKSVLILGVSYKPNISDVRETPVATLITGLREKGARVVWHDDLVSLWNDEDSVPLSGDYDLAILATPHDYFDLGKLGNVPVLNTRKLLQ
jgi:UDP-N-acetyl-D-glucosamine dehydrogenase